MSEYIPKYPSEEGDDSNKTSSELLAETLKPIYVPQDLMLAWESHLASYSRDTSVLLDQVKDSETSLNTQYLALLTRVQKYEQMLQDITMDSNEFTIDTDDVNFTGWNILAQASYWDYLLRKEITKLSDQIKSTEYKGGLVTEVTDAVLEGLIADNNYISNVIGALSDTPLIRELDEALTSTTTSLSDLQAEYVKLAQKQAADAEALANQQVLNAEQLVESINTAVAEQLDRIAQEAAVRTQLLQEIEVRTNEIEQEALERSTAISEHLGVVIGEVTQNVGATTERINSEVAVRNQMIADQSKALVLESEARAAAISTQAAALAAESLARRNAITAQAEAINLEVTNRTKALKDQQEALSSKILSTNESTLAAIETRAVTLAADYNTKVTNLNNQLTGSIENLESGVTTRLNSLDDEDGKLLQNIEAYKTSNNGNVAAIRKDLTTLSTAHGTTASKVEGLVTSFSGLDGKVSKNTTSIASEVTARSNADGALGIRIDNLTVSTSNKFTEVGSSITEVSEAVTSLEQATATRFTGLDSSISGVDDKADTAISNAASAQNTANTAVTTNTAQAQEISKLQGRLDITEGDLLTKASADVVSGILTDVSNIEGKLTVQATSIEDLNASLILVDTKAGTANNAAANAQTTANTAVSNNAATANRVNTLESNMSQVQGDLTTKATASALELTNTEVTRLDGLTKTQTTSITNLNNSLATTNSNVTKALTAVTVTDNRDTNELPLWYWQNHPKRIVNEFKRANVLGVTGLGAYVNLETRVYYDDSSGGPIVQRAVGAADTTLEYVRRSSGTGAGAVWSAWTQPLKAIKDDIATKASSSALSSLDSKVTAIDGRVTSQATSLSELVADLTETNNLLGTVKSTAASALDTANAAVTANTAQASDITQLQAKMVAAEGTLSRKADANALSSLETKVDNNQTATATRIDQLTAAITGLGEGAETAVDVYAFNVLKAEVNTAKGGITSNTTAITDLGSSLNTLDNTVQGIEQETTANANAIQGTSTLVSNIQGQVTSQGTSITNLRSDLTTAQNTANNATSLASTKADATAFNALDTKVTRIDGQVSSQASDITEIKADITDLDGKVNTKADSSALSSLTTKVGQVDGKVTTNANAITTLGGRVSTVEGKVATKAEASALSDYYTKVQADNKSAEIAAGKVEQFSANLKIGGRNLWNPSETISAYELGGSYTHSNDAHRFLPTYLEVSGSKLLLQIWNPNKVISTNYYNRVAFYTEGKVYISSSGLNLLSGETYQKQEFTIPANAKYVRLGVISGLTTYDQSIKFKFELGTVYTEWTASEEEVANAISSNSTAIQNTNAEVSRVDGRVTATNSAQTLLEGRVQTVEGEVTKKADASALTSLSTRVDTEEGKSLSQGNAITTLQNTINHVTTGLASKASSSAVTAVDNKVTAANGRIDTTNSNVASLTGRVSTVEGAVSTKAEASALTALTTRVSNAEGVNTSQGSAITTLENSVNHATTGLTSKASSAALTSVDNKVTAANGRIDATNSSVTTLTGRVSTVEGDVAKKADASAVTALTTRVGNAEGVNTSQGSAITSLQNSVNHATTGLATKASTSALTATNSEVSRVNGLVTGHTNQLTQLASDMTTINGTLETKANATALNDIYTKTQADTKATEIAAGQITSFKASLSSGGANLLKRSNESFRVGGAGSANVIRTVQSDGSLLLQSATTTPWSSIWFTGFEPSEQGNNPLTDIPDGADFIVSFWVKAVDVTKLPIAYLSAYLNGGNSYQPLVGNLASLVSGKEVRFSRIAKFNGAARGYAPHIHVSSDSIGGGIIITKWMIELGSIPSDAWQPNVSVAMEKTDANATAITNTNTEVARVDGRVTTESNRTTILTGRVSTVEGNISKKADASALSSLDTRVGTVEGKYTSQASDITRLNNSLDTTNVNVGTAQTAAQNAMNAAGAKGKVIFGTTAPVVEDRLIQNLWIDTTGNANTPKRWNGSAWVAVTDKVAMDAANAVSALDTVVKTKADVSALNSLTTKVTDEAGKTAANTSSITTLNSDIVKINNDLATKANASALSDMYTKNQTDDKATEIAAGEVSKYDASLVIGGTNLFSFAGAVAGYLNTTTGVIVNSNSSHQSMPTLIPLGSHKSMTYQVWNPLAITNSSNINRVAFFKADGSFISNYSIPQLNGTAYQTLLIPIPALATHARLGVIAGLSGGARDESIKVKIEFGNKATDWSEADSAIVDSLNTNATAIETTNAEVTRVDGRVTTESNRITSLTGRVSTVEGAVSTKADASALNSLTTRVATEEGKSTSQGSAITSLQNTINHATTGLSAKASSAALTAVDNKVTAVDGRVNATNSNVSTLTGRVSTVEGGLATKAEVSAVNALTTRVGNVEGGLSTQASNTTALKAAMDVVGTIAPTSLEVLDLTSLDPNIYYPVVFALSGNIRTRIQISAPLIASENGKPAWGTHAGGFSCMYDWETNASQWGSQPTSRIILTADQLHSAQPPAIDIGQLGNSSREHVFLRGGAKYTARYSNAVISTQLVTASTTFAQQVIAPKAYDAAKVIGTALNGKASAAALTTTNTEVSRIDGVVSGHSTQLTNLNATIAGKADSSALNALTVRVASEEGKSSSQATSITNLNSSVVDALDSVTVKDTRATNQLPSWYFTNYPSRVINEFKQTAAIGVSGFFGGIYCNLETKVYWTDPSGGDLIQTATSSVDPSLYVQRRSSGVSAWTAWAQPIKDLRDGVAGKASASALSTLDTKVVAIDGRVTTQASQLTVLTSDNDANKNALTVQGKVIDGVKASYMVKMETNGVIGGFGLMQSTGVLGQVSTSFGVNADSFFIGAPVGGKKPFMVTTANQVVDGITYPAGTYIDVALIASATIGTAHIANAAITNAKISSLDAAKITTGTLDAARIKVGAATQYEIGYDPITKARTFVAQPVTPYRIGDIWKNGNTTSICTVTRLTGAYVAADWGKTGDVTAENTAANSNQLGGTAAATVLDNASKGLTVYNDVMSDLKITPVEKTALNTEWTRITAEYNSMFAHATSMGVSSTAFTSAYNALNSTSPTMTSILSSMVTTTTVTAAQRDALRTQFTNYYAQVTALGKAISDKVADNAKAYTDAIEVGAANLLYRSYDSSLWTIYGTPALSLTADNYLMRDSVLITQTTFEGSGGTDTLKVYRQGNNLEVGKTLTMSAYVKNRGTQNLTVNTAGLNAVSALTVASGKMERIVFTGTLTQATAQFRILTVAAADAFAVDIIDLKFEYGNKATSWTPSPAEVNALIDSKAKTFLTTPTVPYSAGDIWKDGATTKVALVFRGTGSFTASDWALVGDITSSNTSADTAKVNGVSAATVASNAANGALVYSDVMSDLKITPVEKTAINQEWNRIQTEYASLLAQAQALSLTTTTYTAAYTGLSTTAPAMSTILASMSTTTTLTAAERDAYKSQYTTYYTQAVAITKAINDKIAANAKAQADAKSKTFTAQPVTPYTAGDLWKDGTTIKVCTVTRASGSYTAADWTLVGDVTSANTAANSNQLGGKASATVFSDITNAANTASTAKNQAAAAENQMTLWKYPNSTYIDGGKIYANSITANQISVANLSLISGNLGTIKVGTANIDDLAVTTLNIKDNAVTVPVGIKFADITITGADLSSRAPAGGVPKTFEASVSYWETAFGDLGSITLNRSGGKVMLSCALTFINKNIQNLSLATGSGNDVSVEDRMLSRLVLSIYKGNTLIGRTYGMPTSTAGNAGVDYVGTYAVVAAIDDSSSVGNTTYSMRVGIGYLGNNASIAMNIAYASSVFIIGRSLTAVELKK